MELIGTEDAPFETQGFDHASPSLLHPSSNIRTVASGRGVSELQNLSLASSVSLWLGLHEPKLLALPKILPSLARSRTVPFSGQLLLESHAEDVR